ncbi:MAG TPA: hypothetical protein VLX68_12870 [Chitinivibrionales bacterium]|nr:hypothetical protein [Chitinivibrionales bacterium]
MSDVQIVSIAVVFFIAVTLCIVIIQFREYFSDVHRLRVTSGRLEIIDGLLHARQHASEIDNIKAGPDAEKELKSAFGFSDLQAVAIIKINNPMRSVSEENLREERQRLAKEVEELEKRTGKRKKR